MCGATAPWAGTVIVAVRSSATVVPSPSPSPLLTATKPLPRSARTHAPTHNSAPGRRRSRAGAESGALYGPGVSPGR